MTARAKAIGTAVVIGLVIFSQAGFCGGRGCRLHVESLEFDAGPFAGRY